MLFVDSLLFGQPDSTLGFTPRFVSNQAGIHNFVLYRGSDGGLLLGVAHEIGHVFSLTHDESFFSNSNLMCGRDSVISAIIYLCTPCGTDFANQLRDSQIKQAQGVARKLAE